MKSQKESKNKAMLKKLFSLIFISLLSIPLQAQQVSEQITPSQGASFESIWRGVLGMVVLIFIAYLFSANRKAIQWKTVGIGLTTRWLLGSGFLNSKKINPPSKTSQTHKTFSRDSLC